MSASRITARIKQIANAKSIKVQNTNHTVNTNLQQGGIIPCRAVSFKQIMYVKPICKTSSVNCECCISLTCNYDGGSYTSGKPRTVQNGGAPTSSGYNTLNGGEACKTGSCSCCVSLTCNYDGGSYTSGQPRTVQNGVTPVPVSTSNTLNGGTP